MRKLVFDIETGPATNAADFAPEFQAPSNYKDPVKIAEHIEGQRAAFLERAALDPITGQILCFTSGYDNDPPACFFNEAGNPSNPFLKGTEAMIVTKALCLFEDCAQESVPVVGFNSKGFDLLYLIRRAFILGIPVSKAVWKMSDKYSDASIDLLQIWLAGSRDYAGQSLARVCKACGLGEKNGDGKDFAGILKMDPKSARDYAINDVILTQKLADRLMLA